VREGLKYARELLGRQRGVARGTLIVLEALAALITIAVVVVGLVNHFDSQSAVAIPGEGKRIAAFQQVANRICTEHRGNVDRALAGANNRVERLSFLARSARRHVRSQRWRRWSSNQRISVEAQESAAACGFCHRCHS
jgi:hypothetical protein